MTRWCPPLRNGCSSRLGTFPKTYHIAVAAIYQMDVLLTWNCRHINNPIILPKTISEIALAGYQCPKILTPAEFLEVYDVR